MPLFVCPPLYNVAWMSGDESAGQRSGVRERLLAFPGSVDVVAAGIELVAVPHFLTKEECAGLMRLIDAGCQPSGVLGDHPDTKYRTSETCILDQADPLVQQVEATLARHIPIDPTFGESLQGQRYEVGQEYKEHYDFFLTDQPYWPEQEKIGGQRTWTAMVYLNRVEAGGETFFPFAGIRLWPRIGCLLAWNNLDAAGVPNKRALHQGMPVEAGIKYIITKWYRGRRWG